MKRNDLGYATKVWLTGTVFGPVLFLVWEGLQHFSNPQYTLIEGDWGDSAEFFLLMVLFGMLFSLPSWLVLWLATVWANRTSWTETARRLLLVGVATVLTILPFPLFGGEMLWGGSESWMLILCYWLAIAAGILYFRLGPAGVETAAEIDPGQHTAEEES